MFLNSELLSPSSHFLIERISFPLLTLDSQVHEATSSVHGVFVTTAEHWAHCRAPDIGGPEICSHLPQKTVMHFGR